MVTGNPGHGKSYYGMRQLAIAVEHGRYVVTNMELEQGWALALARTNLLRRVIPGRVKQTAAAYEQLVYTVRHLDEIKRLRIVGCGKCRGCRRGGSCRAEGRGVAILDEAPEWINARTWDIDESGEKLPRNEAVLRRRRINSWFAHHRKFGWKIVLIAQDASMIDNAVRVVNETHVYVKNVRKLAAFWNPLRYLPFNFFVAISIWGGDKTGTRVKTEMYKLNKRIANIYDTMATHTMAEDDQDVIMLGRDVFRNVDAEIIDLEPDEALEHVQEDGQAA